MRAWQILHSGVFGRGFSLYECWTQWPILHGLAGFPDSSLIFCPGAHKLVASFTHPVSELMRIEVATTYSGGGPYKQYARNKYTRRAYYNPCYIIPSVRNANMEIALTGCLEW